MNDQQILAALDFATPALVPVCDMTPSGVVCGDAARFRIVCKVCSAPVVLCAVHRTQLAVVLAVSDGVLYCGTCKNHCHGSMDELFDLEVL